MYKKIRLNRWALARFRILKNHIRGDVKKSTYFSGVGKELKTKVDWSQYSLLLELSREQLTMISLDNTNWFTIYNCIKLYKIV